MQSTVIPLLLREAMRWSVASGSDNGPTAPKLTSARLTPNPWMDCLDTCRKSGTSPHAGAEASRDRRQTVQSCWTSRRRWLPARRHGCFRVRVLTPPGARRECEDEKGGKGNDSDRNRVVGMQCHHESARQQPNQVQHHDRDGNPSVATPATREPLIRMAAVRLMDSIPPHHPAHEGHGRVDEEDRAEYQPYP